MPQDPLSAPRAPRVDRARWLLAGICAVASAWMYHALLRIAPRLSSAEPSAVGEVFPWVRPLTHHSLQLMRQRMVGQAPLYQFMGLCLGLFAAYAVMLWLMNAVRSDAFLLAAAGVSALFRGMLLCSPVMFSFDAYAYGFYGRLRSVYGADAHGPAPSASIADPFHSHGLYQWGPSWYGPLWTDICAAVTFLCGPHVGFTLLVFRALSVLTSLGVAALIWIILRRHWPDRAHLGTLIFLWNPLVIIECGLSGHNDGFMMGLALLAVWLHLRDRRVSAVVALTLSALIKVITAPLIPLYLVMALRQSRGWAPRGWFLLQSTFAAAATLALTMAVARMNPTALLVHDVSSAAFYKNSYHEILFRYLRRRLGENPSTLDAPMDFAPWWVAVSGHAVLHADVTNKSRDLIRLRAGQTLLALSAKDSTDWLRVYDPADHAIGFVNWTHLYVTTPPPDAGRDPVIRSISVSPATWPTVVTANRWIRLATWSLLAAFGLLAAWNARDIDTFITWSTLYFLAAQLLVVTQIWPWYMIWSLAFGALRPSSAATALALILSATFSLFYALLSFFNTPHEWLYDDRSLITLVIPVTLFLIFKSITALARKAPPLHPAQSPQ